MKVKKQAAIWLVTMLAGFANAAAKPGVDTSQIDRMVEYASRLKAQLGPNIKHLSGPAQTLIELGTGMERLKADAATLSTAHRGGASGSIEPRLQGPEMLAQPGLKLAPGIPASAPNLSHTRFSGAVQSGTSTAWCGKKVVVGFNDSDSFWETGGLLAFFGITPPTSGLSLNGYAVSANSGHSFTDKGLPAAGPVHTLMQGDPVLACADPNTFFYASLYEDFNAGTSAISLSRSTNGGDTFGPPKAAVAKSSSSHLLDKPWMTVNQATPHDIFITYTDFEMSASVCGLGSRTAIELVSSTDGGSTWSNPTVVVEVCGGSVVQGSQVVVDPASGNVFVAWELFASDFYTRELDIAKSADSGETFSSPVTVSKADAVGDGAFSFGIQGFIRDFEYPSLTVGKGKNAGALYITWNDGDNRIKDDWLGLIMITSGVGDGNYGFSDVFFSSSADDGSTWSSPVIVNAPSSIPIDHYQPVVASDKTGKVAVCWYDRRRDKNNFLIDRECGKSSNGGATWSNTRITKSNYASVVSQDILAPLPGFGSLGNDYDQLTSEATNSSSGFVGGFVNNQAGNQNVQVNKL